MRLRSLTKHIRDQNWFAVALDFFIVVVGILIAFNLKLRRRSNAPPLDRAAPIHQRAIFQSRFY